MGHPTYEARDSGMRRRAVRIGGPLAIASLLVAMLATQVHASAAITVTVNQFLNVPWVLEGTSNPFAIASFTDANACSAPGVCNPGFVYTAMIDWGDNSTHTSGTVSDVVSQSGNQGTYNVTDSHTYRDEFNCPSGNPVTTSTCGFPVQVQVTNTITSNTSGGGCPPYPTTPGPCIAVKDQTLTPPSTQFVVTVQAGTNYSGSLGTFHDANNMATPLDGSGDEFHVTVKDWGDNTGGDTNPGSFTIDGCPGSGCTVNIFTSAGGHTYTNPGTYTIQIEIGDGASIKTIQFNATAVAVKPKVGARQSSGGTPAPRGTNQSVGSSSQPRLAAHVPPARVAFATRIGIPSSQLYSTVRARRYPVLL